MSGKSVIVTGGGTGIGAACARLLASSGASVTLAGRTESKLAAVTDEILAAGGTARYAVADVTVEDDVERLVAGAVETFGGFARLRGQCRRGWFAHPVSPVEGRGVHAGHSAQPARYDAERQALGHCTRGAGRLVRWHVVGGRTADAPVVWCLPGGQGGHRSHHA